MSASLLTSQPAQDVRELILTSTHADELALQVGEPVGFRFKAAGVNAWSWGEQRTEWLIYRNRMPGLEYGRVLRLKRLSLGPGQLTVVQVELEVSADAEQLLPHPVMFDAAATRQAAKAANFGAVYGMSGSDVGRLRNTLAEKFGHVLSDDLVHCTRCTWTIYQHAEYCTHESLYALVSDLLPLVVR